MGEMTTQKATALRKPFPAESIGQLPKGGVMLDYVGHAAVTDRLLTVDPEWSWDFSEKDPTTGQPSLRHSLDPDGNLWIRLTVCGVSRIGVGDGKNAKERIGDAIRNAAMRFGVALDLWAKENLVEFRQAVTGDLAPNQPQTAGSATVVDARDEPIPQATDKPMTDKTRAHMFALFGDLAIPDEEQLPGINHVLGTDYPSRGRLTEAEAKKVIAVLKKRKDAASVEDVAAAQDAVKAS